MNSVCVCVDISAECTAIYFFAVHFDFDIQLNFIFPPVPMLLATKYISYQIY